MATPLRVIVLEDEGVFVAQCLEVDVAAQGTTNEEAMENLRIALKAEVEESAHRGKDLLDLGPAPREFEAMYESNIVSRTEMRMVA